MVLRATLWRGGCGMCSKRRGGLTRVLQSASYYRHKRKVAWGPKSAFAKAYNYLHKKSKYMDYARYRCQGMPIGSGVHGGGVQRPCSPSAAEAVGDEMDLLGRTVHRGPARVASERHLPPGLPRRRGRSNTVPGGYLGHLLSASMPCRRLNHLEQRDHTRLIVLSTCRECMVNRRAGLRPSGACAYRPCRDDTPPGWVSVPDSYAVLQLPPPRAVGATGFGARRA